MVQLFKNNHAQAILATILFLTAMGILLFNLSLWPEEQGMYPLGEWFKGAKNSVLGGSYQLEFGVNMFLILAQAMYFGFMMDRHDVLHKNTYLPAVFFGLFNLFFPEQIRVTTQLIGNGFMLLAIGNIFRIQGRERALPDIMNAGIFMGIAILFIPQMLVFLPMFLVALFLFKPSRAIDFFQFLFALILPAYLVFVILFFLGYDVSLTDYLDEGMFDARFDDIKQNYVFLCFTGFIILLLIVIFARLQQNFFKNTVKMRKYQQFLLAYFFFAVLILVFSRQPIQQNFTFVAAPLGTFLSYYFLSDKKRWAREFIFLLLLAFVICNHMKLF